MPFHNPLSDVGKSGIMVTNATFGIEMPQSHNAETADQWLTTRASARQKRRQADAAKGTIGKARQTLFLLLFFALLALAALPHPACAARQTSKTKFPGWVIEQRCLTDGNVTLLICDQGARFSWKTHTYAAVCKAPDYKIYLFNIGKKKKMLFAPELWRIQAPHIPNDNATYGKATVTTDSWYGKPAQKTVYEVSGTDPIREQTEQIFQDGHNRSINFNKTELLFCNWINVNPKLLTFLFGYYRYPNMRKIPLQCLNQYPNGRAEPLLKTLSIKETMIDTGDLSPPAQFKTIGLRDELTDDDQRRNSLPGVVEDLFGGRRD